MNDVLAALALVIARQQVSLDALQREVAVRDARIRDLEQEAEARETAEHERGEHD